MRALTISSINRKGGVGKSTTCFHLGGYFAKNGCDTLIIEMDPQGTISQGFFGKGSVKHLSGRETVAAIFDEDSVPPPAESLIVATNFDRLSMVRANDLLDPHNTPEPQQAGLRQFLLAQYIEEIGHLFDVIMIDCPPNLYLSSWNALLASDFVLVPVPPEDPGTQGISDVHEAVKSARLLNPKIQMLGHLVIRRDARLLLHHKFERELRVAFPDDVFQVAVPEAAAIKLAYASRSPISFSDPQSSAGQAIEALGEEIMEVIEKQIEKQAEAV